MKRLVVILTATLAVVALSAPAAEASFGLTGLDVTATSEDGGVDSQAGSHPFAYTTTVGLNSRLEGGKEFLEGQIKDLEALQAPGFIGNQTAMPTCSTVDFYSDAPVVPSTEGSPSCPNSTAVGVARIHGDFTPLPADAEPILPVAVYNLEPPPGEAARLGFDALGVRIAIDIGVSPNPPYNLRATLSDIPQVLLLYSTKLTLWGDPGKSSHDSLRGSCLKPFVQEEGELSSRGTCEVESREIAFLTLPRSCKGPLPSTFSADSWEQPGVFTEPQIALTHDDATPPNLLGMTGCSKLGFSPTISAKPTSQAASSPTGLDFSLDVADEGLVNPSEEATAQADIEKAVVRLPQGFSANPSLAEGLNVCTEADLARESATSAPGAGCPAASKIGTVEVETPLLDQPLKGALFIAKPHENPFDSLLAMYMVLQNEQLGISIKQALKIEPDPVTGRLTTVAEDLPELPFSHFRLHFREGTRSPLATPATCGTFNAEATLYPSSGNPPVTTTSAFQIISGPDNSACPSGGLPPFRPDLTAGSINNAAGHYSPFSVRLSRSDSEQEITRFSIKLPTGVIGKLAGVSECSDAEVAAAKAREKEGGGAEEIAAPSCPQNSEIGRSLVGSGVGNVLAYAPGKLYLAGPYHGSPISIVAITAAKVGPFDLGTVVVRFALDIDHETAAVSVDGANSDPIPHIVDGIPIHLRDIRAYVDRRNFTLNPTSCAKKSTASTVLGSGLDFVSPLDDNPVTVSSPFQAADCASLGFKPKLALTFTGRSTHRADLPALKAVLTYPKKGAYVNIAKAQVTLPPSEILEQAHLAKVCPKSIFITGSTPGENCPKQSIYGSARAYTPLLDEPLEGPVFLRTGYGTLLPELTATLNNKQIHIVLAGKIDSVVVKGTEASRIRNTFSVVPDAPVSKFVLKLKGGDHGLLVNKTNICKGTRRAIAAFTGQNGKKHRYEPVLKVKACGRKPKKPRHG